MAIGTTDEHSLQDFEQPNHFLTDSEAISLEEAQKLNVKIAKVPVYGNLGIRLRNNSALNQIQCTQSDSNFSAVAIGGS